jgi:hypothetical protein
VPPRPCLRLRQLDLAGPRVGRGSPRARSRVYLVSRLRHPAADRKRKAKRHPDLVDGARLTHTGRGIPGDPLNIALVGSEADVVAAMNAAGWRDAAPLGFRSDERIIVDTVLDKPDPTAPVSNLFLFGRKEDRAFEKPIGHSPRERNHVSLLAFRENG